MNSSIIAMLLVERFFPQNFGSSKCATDKTGWYIFFHQVFKIFLILFSPDSNRYSNKKYNINILEVIYKN